MGTQKHNNLVPTLELVWALEHKPFHVLWLKCSFKIALDFPKTLPKIMQFVDVPLGPKIQINHCCSGPSDMCTAEPLRECGNCRAALNETEPLQEAQIFILHKHLNTCWINLFNYSPYCSLRVSSLFINLTARVQDREAAQAYQLTREKPKWIWGILFKSYAFTGVVLWIFWDFFVCW